MYNLRLAFSPVTFWKGIRRKVYGLRFCRIFAQTSEAGLPTSNFFPASPYTLYPSIQSHHQAVLLSSKFFGRAPLGRAIARYLSGRGEERCTLLYSESRPAPRKDTLRISLTRFASLPETVSPARETHISSGVTARREMLRAATSSYNQT